MEKRINQTFPRLQGFHAEHAASGHKALQKLERHLRGRIQSAMDEEWVNHCKKNGPVADSEGASWEGSK